MNDARPSTPSACRLNSPPNWTSYATRKNVPRVSIVETALDSYLSPDGADRLEAALARRLDRMTRAARTTGAPSRDHQRNLGAVRPLLANPHATAFPTQRKPLRRPKAASATKGSSRRWVAGSRAAPRCSMRSRARSKRRSLRTARANNALRAPIPSLSYATLIAFHATPIPASNSRRTARTNCVHALECGPPILCHSTPAFDASSMLVASTRYWLFLLDPDSRDEFAGRKLGLKP